MRFLAVLVVAVALGSSCDDPGDDEPFTSERCEDVTPRCPPGTFPAPVDEAQAIAEEIGIPDLGILHVEHRAFLRMTDDGGCEYACVQELTCPASRDTCLHNGCFACLPPGSTQCDACVEL